MSITVAILAPGAMGAAVARRLTEAGATVRTVLSGRSAASAARAKAAGMNDVGDARALVEDADLLLSIVPPGTALDLANRLAPALAAARRKPVYLDCNAVAPATAAG